MSPALPHIVLRRIAPEVVGGVPVPGKCLTAALALPGNPAPGKAGADAHAFVRPDAPAPPFPLPRPQLRPFAATPNLSAREVAPPHPGPGPSGGNR